MKVQNNIGIAIKRSPVDKTILSIGYVLLGLFVIAIIVPLAYVVIASFMDPNVLNNKGISFNLGDWTVEAYKRVLEDSMIWRGFVGMWNSYFDAMIYINDANLQPLQLVLRSILVQNTPQPGMIADIQSTAELAKMAELLKYSTIVVSSIPLLVMYPFFQKYFDKGVMVGSVKG